MLTRDKNDNKTVLNCVQEGEVNLRVARDKNDNKTVLNCVQEGEVNLRVAAPKNPWIDRC